MIVCSEKSMRGVQTTGKKDETPAKCENNDQINLGDLFQNASF